MRRPNIHDAMGAGSYFLEFMGLEGGRVPVPFELSVGQRVGLSEDHLRIFKADSRGVPPGLRGQTKLLALSDDAVTWGVGSGHCAIWVERYVVWIEDYGSDNGVLVSLSASPQDGSRIDAIARQHELPAGCHIWIGRCHFRIVNSA